MTYIPKVGDRVKWISGDPYTVIAVGKQRALLVADGGTEHAARITSLIPTPDTVTIEISREDAEELLQLAEERDDLKSWLRGSSWIFSSELRLRAKLRAALAGEK